MMATHRSPINRVAVAVAMVVGVGVNNTAVGTPSVGSAMGSSRRTSGLRHGAARSVGRIERGAAPSGGVVLAPTGLARPHGVVEAVEGGGACAVDEGRVADKRGVVDWGGVVSTGQLGKKGDTQGKTYSGSPRRRRRPCDRR